jgi:hypothetical protein
MTMRSMDQLHDFLSSGKRELVNVKFFPGSNRGLTSEQLASAAMELLSDKDSDLTNNPPVSGVEPRRI